MEGKIIFLDTSVLIEYYRKPDKSNSLFLHLERKYPRFAVSVITEFEIYRGVKDSSEKKFWDTMFERFALIPVDRKAVATAVIIYRELKKTNLLLPAYDLLIGATAVCHKLKLATLNANHFERIEKLNVVTSISTI